MQNEKEIISPSRTYVAMCIRSNFDGYYFRKFVLPTHYVEGVDFEDGSWSEGSHSVPLKNNAATAIWYFGNFLNFVACYERAIPIEMFLDVKDQNELNEESRRACQAMMAQRSATT